MLKIISHKVAQLFPERFPGEHSEMRDDYARDQYESDQYSKYNVYFIRETFLDPTTGQETEHTSDDGYTSIEEAEHVVQSGLKDSIEGGAVEIDIVHRDEGWQKTVWSRDEEPMPQPMSMPFSR